MRHQIRIQIERIKVHIMKNRVSGFAAIVFAFAMFVSPAWAGSVASVNQSGDNGIAFVFQKKNITFSSMVNVKSPVVQYVAGKQIEKLAGRIAESAANDNARSCGYAAPRWNNAFLSQSGFGNKATTGQFGGGNTANTQQSGSNNAAYTIQSGTGHHAQTVQTGNNNIALVVQKC
ncbi:hypothetical protein [Parvibaculum sp.]|uniref:hypothetical protein n=1 Tax=Parvibaculum sp. TaxID=2024848 RepID=UPI001D52E0DF|nr:hypothetical protein [Parvibaculum sp.]MBX3490630.1 hypothetical protein [Parvibaculum sp.]MCW5728534.1 hypothetical protein [Parvibaculum sp.]